MFLKKNLEIIKIKTIRRYVKGTDRQIFPKEIGVSVHVEENDNIYINSITIRLEETVSNKEEISQVVQEQTGITPEILEESEEAS